MKKYILISLFTSFSVFCFGQNSKTDSKNTQVKEVNREVKQQLTENAQKIANGQPPSVNTTSLKPVNGQAPLKARSINTKKIKSMKPKKVQAAPKSGK